MGLIGKVLKHAIRDAVLEITSELWQDDPHDSAHCATPGIVGLPIEGDKAIIINVNNDGSKSIFLGVLSDTDQGINAGEVIIYSRDSDGNVKAKVYFDKDGNVVINDDVDNAVRFSELKTAYDTLRDDFNSFVTTTYNVHNHPTAPNGPVTPPSAIGSSSSGNVDGAKIDNILVP
jgi:hypothetical protein